MADLGTTTAPPPHVDGEGARTDEVGRRVTRRRTLPGGRAVVGALLITLAVIGVFAAWLTATAAPTTSYAVVTTGLVPGAELAPGDLRLVPMDLPGEQAARAFTSVDAATSSVALAPLEPGDLLTRSAVRPPDEVPGTSLFSFEVATARAVAGALSPGDRVDVLATDEGATGFVATDIPVVDADTEGGDVVVTVAIDDPTLVVALAHASDEGTLHVALANTQRPADAGVRRDSFVGAGTGDAPGTTPQPAPQADPQTDPQLDLPADSQAGPTPAPLEQLDPAPSPTPASTPTGGDG